MRFVWIKGRCAVVWLAMFGIGVCAARAADALDTALETCWSCHGANGAGNDPTVPVIWGQNARYLEKQIRDFSSGDREDQIMSSMASSLRREDISRAAALIAAKPWPGHADTPAAAAPDALAACQGCHGADLSGGDSPEGAAPRLAGQFADYLATAMSGFAGGERANQKTMSAMMKALKPDERAALAKYLAGL